MISMEGDAAPWAGVNYLVRSIDHTNGSYRVGNSFPTPTNPGQALLAIQSAGARAKYETAERFVCFLFHDIKPWHTLDAMRDYLAEIRSELRAKNKVPPYISKTEIEALMDTRTFGVSCP
jgi:hypothetical protein